MDNDAGDIAYCLPCRSSSRVGDDHDGIYDIYSCTVKGRLLEIDDRVFDLHQLVNQMALLVTAVDLCSTSWPHGSDYTNCTTNCRYCSIG